MTSNKCNCTTYSWKEMAFNKYFRGWFTSDPGIQYNVPCITGTRIDIDSFRSHLEEYSKSVLQSELNTQMELVIAKLNETAALFDYEHERNAIKAGVDAIQSLRASL